MANMFQRVLDVAAFILGSLITFAVVGIMCVM